jgi:hypothetical protein
VLNVATPLLAGMSEKLGEWPPTVGVGLLGDMQFNPTYQWVGAEVAEQTALALRFSNVRLDYTIMHGCEPVGDYHTITKADYNVVLEIDGRPALEVIAQMLGPGADRPSGQQRLDQHRPAMKRRRAFHRGSIRGQAARTPVRARRRRGAGSAALALLRRLD